MRVVPVVDLQAGQVVRGVGGRRHEYRPIESVLCCTPEPASVARSLAGCGFRTVYVADLDAIAGAGPHWPAYAELMRAGLDVWLDAGLSSVERAQAASAFAVDGRHLTGIVAGLESLADPRALDDVARLVGPERLIFSLDLMAGEPLSDAACWRRLRPLEIACLALRAGVRRLIVLDLARVGMRGGVGTEPLCRALRALDAGLEITVGGGVRSAADLEVLARAGADAALVATALHDGRLTAVQCVHHGYQPEAQAREQ